MNISKLDLLLAVVTKVGPQEKYLEEERKKRMPDPATRSLSTFSGAIGDQGRYGGAGAGRQTTESKQKPGRIPMPLFSTGFSGHALAKFKTTANVKAG